MFPLNPEILGKFTGFLVFLVAEGKQEQPGWRDRVKEDTAEGVILRIE